MNKYKSMCVQFPILNSNLNVISIANILKRETYWFLQLFFKAH